jgi:2-polyprenyl-3-methyl-5-hydroxy-6-metoxy-1,4-benzoquinol methylase
MEYVEGQIGGNFSDKYHTKNPIARRLMNGFFNNFESLVRDSGVSKFYEIGCGEGELSVRLAQNGYQVIGSDISKPAVDEANKLFANLNLSGIFYEKSIYDLTREDMRDSEAIVICEVFEHLNEPKKALEHITSLGPKKIITSVPREPIWCALNFLRGKYISRLGNTPGHVQHWSRQKFIEFISKYYKISDIRSPLPWTMLSAEIKG